MNHQRRGFLASLLGLFAFGAMVKAQTPGVTTLKIPAGISPCTFWPHDKDWAADIRRLWWAKKSLREGKA